MAATGAVSGMGQHTALEVVERIRERVREVFGRDERSTESLEHAIEEPGDEARVRALAEALAWYAQRNEGFAEELDQWARDYEPSATVSQNVRAGRDAYTAGRDMTINQRPEG